MSQFIVAVTGGVASGKSEVTRLFASLGVAVIDADVAARQVVAKGSPGLAEVIAVFGDGVLDADGELDRAAMRRRVFEDDAARRQLEAVIHPQVRRQMQRQSAASSGEYAIVAIPLLTEGGGRTAYPWLDRILVIDVSVAVQRSRLERRDGIDRTLADRMIAAQATREARLAIADDVIVNDGTLDALRMQVEGLDKVYRAAATEALAQSRE